MTEHYFTEKPTSQLITKEISPTLLGNKLKITTASGLFSKDRIDKASQILIENAVIEPNTTVLDLGCGYGIVGIAITKAYEIKKTFFLDINERAITLTKENCKKNNIKNYKVIKSNIYEKLSSAVDTILLNPPQTAGKKICEQMIIESIKHLNNNGTLQIVARHNKGGKSLANIMEETFGNAESIVKSGGIRVYLSRKQIIN